jgi:ppGpp synthetase/RelA/SpoT-type nucleotidyltranferase
MEGKTVWEAEYRERKATFERLASEIEFALESVIESENIKAHSITKRVKSAKSIAEKAERKEFDDPLGQLEDIVGVRVVTLFLSDLPRLDELIRKSFTIYASDDKVTGNDPASFGYMSVHYVASLHDKHSGPRYDDLKGVRFEIQTRTIVMDAWANISHYLDYKGTSSIPEGLRKDFFALSGLFYVADQHFEIFTDRAQLSQEKARQELQQSNLVGSVDINLDTMQAFLLDRYKDRRDIARSSISEFVEEVTRAGYDDIGTLERTLDGADHAFAIYEERYPPAAGPGSSARFANLGAARITLALADKKYAVTTSNSDEGMEELALWA